MVYHPLQGTIYAFDDILVIIPHLITIMPIKYMVQIK